MLITGDPPRRDRPGRLGRASRATTTSRSSSSSTGSRCRSRSSRSSSPGRSGPSPASTCTASAGFNRFFVLYSIFVLGHGRDLAGRDHRDPVRRLGAGRALLGAAGRVLPGAAGPVAERAVGLDRLSGLGRRAAAGRGGDAPPEGRGGLRQAPGHGPLARRAFARRPRAQALLVGLLLLVAAAGKSALFPFSGWLPRAMEGPTPSSAVFYGAPSVHLGAFLLLRVSPLLDVSVCSAR